MGPQVDSWTLLGIKGDGMSPWWRGVSGVGEGTCRVGRKGQRRGVPRGKDGDLGIPTYGVLSRESRDSLRTNLDLGT